MEEQRSDQREGDGKGLTEGGKRSGWEKKGGKKSKREESER